MFFIGSYYTVLKGLFNSKIEKKKNIVRICKHTWFLKAELSVINI